MARGDTQGIKALHGLATLTSRAKEKVYTRSWILSEVIVIALGSPLDSQSRKHRVVSLGG